jgi:hypothetical protein
MRIFFKIIYIFIVILFLIFIIREKQVAAAEIAGHSARLNFARVKTEIDPSSNDFFFKAKAIEEILSEYNSPLAGETEVFIQSCRKYNLDCYLLPAIAGLESTFGQFIYPQSYNPFGWGGGYIIFNSWAEAINTVAQGLRKNYLDKGAETIDEIGVIYSESQTWARRVNWFVNKFEQKEKEIRLRFTANKVEL